MHLQGSERAISVQLLMTDTLSSSPNFCTSRRYEHASAEEAEALCALSDTTQDILPRLEAHELLCRSVTPRILSLAVKGSTGWESAAKRTMELLHGLSEQTLPSWDIMGGVVLTFLTLLCGEGSERNKYWNDGPYLHSFMSRVPHFPVTVSSALIFSVWCLPGTKLSAGQSLFGRFS